MRKGIFNKLMVIVVGLIVLPALSGCMVKESTYLKKVAEQEALQQKYNQLDKDKADLLQKKLECDRDLQQSMAALQEKNVDLKSLQKKKEEIQTESQAYKDLLREMKGEMARGQVTIEELKGKLTLGLADQILFDSGQSEVKKDGLAILKRIVDILGKVNDKAIRVEGHTDNVKIAGRLARRFPTNWELSAARAINVARFLQDNGIEPTILSAVAYGEYKPIADNSTPEGRQKNRRIAIILLPKD
ncbi:MAG: chemotaxis protein MotB [Deltaproteobacteria bacterium HGW-Deltaproteobacteria-19]|jgi:chemotaxis protein MotB|nr:MAG: chemotaxis protein MotB [Deltaproteobacteria bacterium HGW-Deltaproteobacteria-19]